MAEQLSVGQEVTIELRPYQQDCLRSIYQWLRDRDDSPVATLATGLGKSVIIAQIAREAVACGERCLVLVHTRELVANNAEAFRQLAPDLADKVGIYSAGLNRRDVDQQIIFAGIQSVYKRAKELGPFSLIIIDEAHLCNFERDESIYKVFLIDTKTINPACRLVGFTATSFRHDNGPIYGGDKIFGGECFTTDLLEMIKQKYLMPIVTKASKVQVDLSEVHLRGGEYIPGELERAFDHADITKAALDEAIELAGDRKHWLCFASGVDHARHIAASLSERGIPTGCVTGDMPTAERDTLIDAFKAGQLRCLVSVMVLTTGINIPAIDLIIFLRATRSAGLWIQCLGRGMRPAPRKENCLLLDYGQNAVRFGPIDLIKPSDKSSEGGEAPCKVCPKCQEVILISLMVCPACGFEYPKADNKPTHESKASDAPVFSSQRVTLETLAVTDYEYCVWTKKGASPDAPKTLRCDYYWSIMRSVSEWICFEHKGFARQKAEAWWKARSKLTVPATAEEAAESIRLQGHEFAHPAKIKLDTSGKWPTLVETILPTPCSGCVWFDNGYCHNFGEDVPDKFQKDGCENFKVVVENSAAPSTTYGTPPTDDCPF